MNKFIVYDHDKNRFTVLSSMKSLIDFIGFDVGKRVKECGCVVKVMNYSVGWVSIPKDNRGGNRGNISNLNIKKGV